ncbi:MAG: hypothetical protein ABL893_21255 [Hyphomicrobium sp.]
MPSGGEVFLDAFYELTNDRHYQTGPIPFASIDAYAHRFGFTDLDDFAMFRRVLRALDATYLPIIRKQIEDAMRKASR